MSYFDSSEDGDGSLLGRTMKDTRDAGRSAIRTVGSFLPLSLFALIAIAGLVGAAMLWSKWSIINDDLPYQCDSEGVDKYSLNGRVPDASSKDWKMQSRDYASSAHNGHVSMNPKHTKPGCDGINYFLTTTDGVGVTVTPTYSSALDMLFFADHGDGVTHEGVTLYGVQGSSCTQLWSKTLTALGSQTSPAPKGNDATGVDNALADLSGSLQIAQNETGGWVIVFGDMGTSALYNLSACEATVDPTCGARVYVLDATTGDLLVRTLIVEDTPVVTNYSRQSDMIRDSVMVYQGVAYFGTSSNQTYDVLTTDVLNFYALYGGVDINSGDILSLESVNDATQITAGNLGSMIDGTPVVDVDGGMVYYGSAYALNQTASVSDCLAAGGTRKDCLETGMNNNQLFAVPVTVPTSVQWRSSPYGVDAWNEACELGDGAPCPTEHGPGFAYSTGSMIIKNQCGQRFVISVGKSGTLYSNDATSGSRVWTTYLGPSSNETSTFGMSFDGSHIFLPLGNLQKKNYLTLSGVLRCDSMWVKVDAWTGEISEVVPVPCSRSSAECIALNGDEITPDPALSGYFSANILNYGNRGTQKNGDAMPCFQSEIPADIRDTAQYGAIAVGPVITNGKYMFAGSFTGHVHVYQKSNMHKITSLERCSTGVVFGGPSLFKMASGENFISYGCGYGSEYIPASLGDNEVMLLRFD